MLYIRICKHCLKEYTTKSHRSKFCDTPCRENYYYHNNPKTNERVKSYSREHSKEYRKTHKKQIRIRSAKWRESNREHFNTLCREPSRLYQIKLREERRAKKLCFHCGKKALKDRPLCEKCRKLKNKWARESYNRNKEMELLNKQAKGKY